MKAFWLLLPASLLLTLPLQAGPARRALRLPKRPAAAGPADPAAQALLKKMLNAENSLAFSGDQITTVARGDLDLSSEQQVQRQGAKALRIDYLRPARLAGEQIVDNGRFYSHYVPSKDTLELSPSRLGTLRVRVPEVLRQVRQGRLSVRSLGLDTVAGRSCTVVEVTTVSAVPAATRRFWIDPTNGAQLRIEQYDPDGKLRSSSYYSQVSYTPAFSGKTFQVPKTGGKVVATGFAPATLTLDQVQAQAGFTIPTPAYLPSGFHFSGGAISDSRRGRVVELRYVGGGATALSLFETPDKQPGGPTQRSSTRTERTRRGVVAGRQAGMKLVLIGNLADSELKKVLESVK